MFCGFALTDFEDKNNADPRSFPAVAFTFFLHNYLCGNIGQKHCQAYSLPGRLLLLLIAICPKILRKKALYFFFGREDQNPPKRYRLR